LFQGWIGKLVSGGVVIGGLVKGCPSDKIKKIAAKNAKGREVGANRNVSVFARLLVWASGSPYFYQPTIYKKRSTGT